MPLTAEQSGPTKFTFQETYDHVALRLVAQGRPSYRFKGNADVIKGEAYGCLYRGDGDDRCAAGHCFEVPEGTRVPEGVSLYHDLINSWVVGSGHSMDILPRLQSAHDAATNDIARNSTPNGWEGWVDRWAVYMRGIAEDFALSTKVLDDALAARAAAAV